jgi:hypothetical protein
MVIASLCSQASTDILSFSYPTRHEVDTANETRLKQLPGDPHTYQSMDLPGYDSKGKRVSEQTMERLLERLIASKMVSLKVGIYIHTCIMCL